jgi:hypothetical protein
VIVPIADRVGNTLWRERNPVFLRKQYATTTVPSREESEP